MQNAMIVKPAQTLIWDDAQIALLRDLCTLGLAYKEIANRLGVTKNAAIGKAYRLGIHKVPRPTVPFVSRKHLVKPIPVIVPPPDPILFLEVGRGYCRFPLWTDPAPPVEEMLVCGKKVANDSASYCTAHRQRCFQQRRAA